MLAHYSYSPSSGVAPVTGAAQSGPVRGPPRVRIADPPHVYIPPSSDQSVPEDFFNILNGDTDTEDSDERAASPVVISPTNNHVPQDETSRERSNVEVIVLGSSDDEDDVSYVVRSCIAWTVCVHV